jgi:beta-galactosidase
MHKFALHRHLGNPTVVQGSDVTVRETGATWVIQWDIKPGRRVIRIGLLWRNEGYNYWPMELSAPEPIGNFTSPSKELVIVTAGYLVRTAHINKRQLWLTRRKLVTSDHKCRMVSKGILNHNGLNYIELTLWALDS